ncbi:LOW QUALITY PROTEIN: vacuolar protein sorting-associated protein 13D-like [Formica exsecta]|uniref:LOW QUALITY PROTEIN: vacuolar protein sorting-associated protein 13D-like n=1 Tax=Formica exsecta TaxID=72781 RepID=UPI001143D37A|nr:LOW QUALITY PROTEIN: vacuolar protein sorting-associated protein 13D-like [Formica exsecta]
MLEGLVAWVLNNYLGKYVENLNTDQLSIALLSGEVELENLPLKREALRHIGLPMEIKAGFIGKIRLQVPVRQIRTASWVIGIEQLYLVAGPINLDEYDNELEEQAILEYKLSRLDALEARWRADIEHNLGYYASSYSSWLNYGTSLVTNIIENLQLNIKDVHIRYEDDVTLSNDNGIAFGITIGALTTQSCDASWIPSSTSWNLTDASFKLMELDSLSIYWNHVKKDQLLGGLNLGDLAIAMSESKNMMKRHILSPVNARAHIKRDRTERPLRSNNKPRIVVDLLLDEVPLSLTDIQYEEMVKCIKELDRIDRRKQQWRCRPITPVKKNCKEWWKYAARCHLGRDTLKPKPSWENLLLRARENVSYVQAYAKLLGTPTSILPPETKTLKEKVENERNFDELRVLRELAMYKVRPTMLQQESNTKMPQGRGMLEQWFPQWWGWYSKTPHSNNGTQNGGTTNSSTTFDGELLDVLADTMNDDTLLRRDTIFGQFNFALVQGAVSLCTARNGSDGTKTVIELKFERVNLSYESRPRSGSHKFSISLGALYLHDFLTENSTFPILVQPQIMSSSTSSRVRNLSSEKVAKQTSHHLFELVYEKKPLHVNMDHLLHMYSQSLDIVYNPTVIYWLIDFIYKPHRSASSNQQLQAMKRRTRRQLIKNWEQILDGDFVYRSSWDLQFKISAPQILLVESFVDFNAAVIVVDFGKLHLSNYADLNQVMLKTESINSDNDDDEEERYETPCSTPPGSQENGSLNDFQALSETELHKKLYDQYSINLVDLQILVGKAKDNWKHVRTRSMSTLHFLERFNISLQVERRVFTTSDPNFPSVTVSGNLPRLVVHVNEQKVGAIRLMYNLLSSFSNSAGIPQTEVVNVEPESPKKEENLDRSLSHAVMVQFIIDQMAFELQSRGRSVAELQVSGVRAALSKRMADLSVSLSVHGLLLVDALLSNFARQIGAAATDMAIGLVNADEWTIPPRKRLPSVSIDLDNTYELSLDIDDYTSNSPIVQVNGAVITPLKVSLSRGQYEQLLDTFHRLFSMPVVTAAAAVSTEYDDPDGMSDYSDKLDLCVKVSFELPILSVELKQTHSEQPLVELSMRDFVVKYEKLHRNESSVQVALRSLLMEDLLCPIGSRHRYMMQSSAPARAKLLTGASKSCPDLAFARQYKNAFGRGSLPDRLETDTLYGTIPAHWRRKPTISSADTPNTPPPSPGGIASEENLVLMSITMTRPEGTMISGEDRFDRKMVTVDFNCLDLVISVESWMVVFDFFGIAGLSGTANNEIAARQTTPDSDSVSASKIDDNLPVRSETEIEVRSLTLVLTQQEREIAKANVSNANVHILKAMDDKTKISGSLGSMSLLDLTPHGRFYRERFLSSGRKALNFQYSSYADCEDRPHDARLKLEMSAVHYVHTQRFVAELQAFFGHFSQLWSIMKNLRAGAGAVIDMNKRGTRLLLQLHAGAPVILLPVSSRSDKLILLDLGELTAHNRFDTSTIVPECMLDVMLLELVNMDIYAAERFKCDDSNLNEDADTLTVGGFLVKKMGSSLLTEKCHLKLRVERNLDTYISRDIPDLSVHGILSTMDCALDPAQYMLIRGLLSYNIGENLDDLRLFVQDLNHIVEYAIPTVDNRLKTWTRSCIILELVNVRVKLHPSHNIAALACINFIKSRLTLDSLSDGSQDIDLVSQEILIMDTRFQNEPIDRQCNVFTRILQPLRNSADTNIAEDRVQAEVHHRKRKTYSATTILLHSMRLTAILDWWQAVRDFLLLNSPEPEPLSGTAQMSNVNQEAEIDTATMTIPFELKVNITDSELVIVEDTAILDTNVVILKTTAVLSYRSMSQEGKKPLSCNLSHCELFSCILGLENETALSIIDPVGASLDLTQDKSLEIQLQPLCVRLSYHDVTMFSRMLNSLPKQTLWAKQRSSEVAVEGTQMLMDSQVLKLVNLGFAEADCKIALDRCDGQLDDAALWLTQNAEPTSSDAAAAAASNDSIFRSMELEASCIRICIIDDCRDADVPLLEITLADFSMRKIRQQPGFLSAIFSVDYYNRVLSGWEPFVEPWQANIQWEQALTGSLEPKRLYVSINSQDSVNINVTLTLVELVQLVKHNWTQDYYLSHDSTIIGKPVMRGQVYRRRSPFVPFALKNDTGCRLWFKTFIAIADDTIDIDKKASQARKDVSSKDDTWIEVTPGGTISFTFEGRGKLRHHATHIIRRHQIAVLIEGWKAVDPVTVDRVGIYFRHANADVAGSQFQTIIPKARVVFAVELEGSARKLVTIRSALQVSNKLAHPIEIKMEKSLNQLRHLPLTSANTGRILQIPAQSVMSVPLTHTGVQMCFKPLISNYLFQYCVESVDWTIVKKPLEVTESYITCRTNQHNIFRMCVAVRRNNYPLDGVQVLPAHTITVMAPVTLTNLLPYELMYEASIEGGRVAPGCSADLHCANLIEQLEITIQLDGYPGSGVIILPSNSCSFTARLKLLDSASRMLCLQAAVIVEKGSAVQINITAPYWIVNKTGLPLVFRQEGVGIEAAGQFEEHERARMVAPLLFSFSDEEASRTLSVRIGTEVHPYGIPQWSQHFHLQPGIHVHRLRISLRDGRPDIVYLISVATRAARGRYRATTVVTLSPRYQLHNKSSYTLELAQKCFTTTVSHPDAQATYITTMPECHMPFHWPRLDKDLLLCVRITNVPDCMWSGGIRLDDNYSLTVNVRDMMGKMHFLRVDVVLQETTYFIVFTDADTMPPPIRVDNFSEVPLIVNQIGVPDNLQWTVRSHSSVPYALDEPIQTADLVLTAPGGVTASYDLNIFGEGRGLTYENFIYIAFSGTFKTDSDLGSSESDLDPLDVETQRLVLEAGSGGWVALRRKQYGDRSQLWRMTGDGQLQHEGSSPPRDKHSKTPDTIFVLDIAGTAPQPFTYCALALKKPDPRRRSTQTWRFTDDGRLCCAHKNMCVQSKDGFMGLYEGGSVARWQMWSEAVLGPQVHGNPPPIEQRVGRQKLRPGSGFLSIRVTTDGPTRVLQVLDIKERKKTFALLEERDWSHIAVSHRPTRIDADIKKMDSGELDLKLNLPAGLGLSIVSQRPLEELLFARLAGISLDMLQTPLNTTLDLSVADVQIDNQLFEAQCTSVLFVTRSSRTEDEYRPALHLAVEKLQSKNQNAEIYKHVIVSVKALCVHLEEKFILKLAAFLGIGKSELEMPVDENDFKAQRFISEVSAAHAKRYYFGALKLVPNQVKLSVLTTTKLPHHLQAVKRKLGLTLINFENATIELEPFVKKHPFESSQFLMHSIVKHYKDELKWQAAVILGSVDFLGNPLGFMNDVTEGVSGLIYEGSVKSLVKNVTHGISNSAAKVTESLSDGLGRVIMDERHEEARQRIRANTTGSSDHLVAGLKGFGFGLLGGVTSIFKQTYDGATNEGFPGFFAGFGRGVVGTITKPVVGVLDLATETASAVRETSRSAHRAIPKRDRPPRVVSGSTGLLPPYNRQQAEGQEFLYSINNRDYSELFVAYECLCSGTENLRVLVSNERVRVISGGTKAVVTQVNLADLLRCQPMQKTQSNNVILYYIELISRFDSSAAVNLDGVAELLRRPKVRCDNEEVAKRVSQQINYAKGMHEERSLTLSSSDNMLDDVQYYK